MGSSFIMGYATLTFFNSVDGTLSMKKKTVLTFAGQSSVGKRHPALERFDSGVW